MPTSVKMIPFLLREPLDVYVLYMCSACGRMQGRGPSFRARLGRCAECSGPQLLFWFWRPVVKMTDILQGLGKHLVDRFLSNERQTHIY